MSRSEPTSTAHRPGFGVNSSTQVTSLIAVGDD